MTDKLNTSITSLEGLTISTLDVARLSASLHQANPLPKAIPLPIQIGAYTIVPKCACRTRPKQVKHRYEEDKYGTPKLDKKGQKIPVFEYVRCEKTVKVPNYLFSANPEAEWFRKHHDPRFHNSSVSFRNPETA